MLTVMDYHTEAGFKALKADFHTIMKQMHSNGFNIKATVRIEKKQP